MSRLSGAFGPEIHAHHETLTCIGRMGLMFQTVHDLVSP